MRRSEEVRRSLSRWIKHLKNIEPWPEKVEFERFCSLKKTFGKCSKLEKYFKVKKRKNGCSE